MSTAREWNNYREGVGSSTWNICIFSKITLADTLYNEYLHFLVWLERVTMRV